MNFYLCPHVNVKCLHPFGHPTLMLLVLSIFPPLCPQEAYRRWVCSTLIPYFAEPDDIRQPPAGHDAVAVSPPAHVHKRHSGDEPPTPQLLPASTAAAAAQFPRPAVPIRVTTIPRTAAPIQMTTTPAAAAAPSEVTAAAVVRPASQHQHHHQHQQPHTSTSATQSPASLLLMQLWSSASYASSSSSSASAAASGARTSGRAGHRSKRYDRHRPVPTNSTTMMMTTATEAAVNGAHSLSRHGRTRQPDLAAISDTRGASPSSHHPIEDPIVARLLRR